MNPNYVTKVPMSSTMNANEKMLLNSSEEMDESAIKQPSLGPYQHVDLYDGDKKKSKVTVLIEIGEYVGKFHDPNNEAYVILVIDGHDEVWPMKSKAFRDWLSLQYFQLSGTGTDRSSINDALSTLAAMAKFKCEKRKVYRRVAGNDETIYIDLCDKNWRVIEVNAEGFQILDKSPVMFIRNKGMTALPVPNDKGSIEPLWGYLNIEEKKQSLVMAYLVAAFRPEGPYPILVLC